MVTRKKHIARIRSESSLIRKQGKRRPKPIVLIACEGETEKLYFEAMKRELWCSSIEIKVPPSIGGTAPINVVEFAEKKCKEPYDYAYCVFDRDNHSTFSAARDKIKSLATRNRNPLPLREAISVICFEIWVLLHFAKTTKTFSNSDEVIRHIQDNNYIRNYSKTDPKLFEQIKDKLGTAIENAKWLENQAANNGYDPYTQVHHLVQFLQELSNVS